MHTLFSPSVLHVLPSKTPLLHWSDYRTLNYLLNNFLFLFLFFFNLPLAQVVYLALVFRHLLYRIYTLILSDVQH